MQILWLSWRDIKNPEAGGAEKVAIETASRFAKQGIQVTIFTSSYPQSKATENIRGVKIIRRGNQITCRLHAYFYYLKSKKIDVIIDEINTIPFFSVLYAKSKTIALIHQLAKEYWFKETFFPVSIIGYLLEPLWLKLYSKRPTIALSDSTKNDLLKLGFSQIKTYSPGLDIEPKFIPGEKRTIVVFVGRLTKAKNPRDAIIAFEKIHQKLPSAKLIIIGKGNPKYVLKLKDLVKTIKLEASIKFTGYINNQKKIHFLRLAKVVLIPSVREGWNLVATEANATGCVPVGYNVPGLRDSILDRKTGILIKEKSPEKLAEAAIAILSNNNLYQSLAHGGLAWAKKFNWNKTFSSFQRIIKEIPKRILWLSWRDIKNPDAGGAEKVAIETASRLVKNGTDVTIFTSRFKNSTSYQKVRNVSIVRGGNLLTCRIMAFFYQLKNRNFDIIIDEINTIPFFSIFYARNKTFALVHQLAREYWFTQTIWPLSYLGYFLEPFILKLYKKRPTLVVSQSTKLDLENLGFNEIKVIREGLDFTPRLTNKKQDLILFIGRLTLAKGPQDAIAAFKIISSKFPKLKLYVIGQGEKNFVVSLKKLAQSAKLKQKIIFTDFIAQRQKIDLLEKARLVLIPSVREGWNLVATEANATGAVPIAYDVPGLRDSIKNGKNGILVEKSHENLAQAAIDLLKNGKKRSKLQKNGLKYAKNFNWDNTYQDFRDALGTFGPTADR